MMEREGGVGRRALHLLGTGGWMPSGRRETSCFAVRHNRNLLILDAGTGLRRLVDNPILRAGIDRIDIALSHFHLDHTIGLSYLDAIDSRIEKHLWGPGLLLYQTPTESIIERLLSAPFNAAKKSDMYSEIHDYKLRGVGPHAVEVGVQRKHSDPSVAFRYEDKVAYCTDTAFDANNIGMALGVDVLLHEAWHTSENGSPFHSSAMEAATIAKDAGVGQLVLVHLDPRLNCDLALSSARIVFDPTVLGEDETEIDLGAAN